MIKKYIEAIQAGDYKALAQCFTPKCQYNDYCPSAVNRANYHVYGRSAIEMYFHNKFVFHQLKIFDAVIEDDNSAYFLVSYGGSYTYARAIITQFSEDGLIAKLSVRPD